MKPIYVLVAAAASLSAASAQQVRASAPTRDAATHEQILAQRQELQRQAEEKAATTVAASPVTLEKDPSKVNKPTGLIGRSEVLSYNGYATLVPKRAIIHLPGSLGSRLGLDKSDKIQGWQEFYLNNRGWISTVEVTPKQAEGKEPLPEETLKTMGESSSIIVATYQGEPISVLPVQAVQTEGATSNPESK